MEKFEIVFLADRPEFIDACAAWAYGRWGVQKKGSSFENVRKIFKNGAQKEALPLTVIAINRETNLPVAMGSLWEKDGEHWQNEVSPWIASVFTLYRYRGKGLAKKIIERLEFEGKRLGFNEIYLQSGSAAEFYPQLGYVAIDKVVTQTTAAGTETLFKKKI